MTLSALLSHGKKTLKEAGIESYSIDAEVLLMHLLSFPRERLYIENELVLDGEIVNAYNRLLEQRSQNMPVAYIIKSREFMSLPFYVDESVLIPRGDTELVVETAIEIINKNDYAVGLEIGVGSGCISVSLAKCCANLRLIGCDISRNALVTAVKNMEINKVNNKISLFESDLFEKLPEQVYGELDFIISNPPYIRTGIIPSLDIGVKDFEPLTALDGGADGLDFYRRISHGANLHLIDGGHLLFEIGYDQAEDVCHIMDESGFSNITVLNDLAGLNRVVYGMKRTDSQISRRLIP